MNVLVHSQRHSDHFISSSKSVGNSWRVDLQTSKPFRSLIAPEKSFTADSFPGFYFQWRNDLICSQINKQGT